MTLASPMLRYFLSLARVAARACTVFVLTWFCTFRGIRYARSGGTPSSRVRVVNLDRRRSSSLLY